MPALDDDGRVMFESVAIMQYIMGRYGPTDLDVRPDEADYHLYLQWLHFGESGMIMPVSLTMLAEHGLKNRDFLVADLFTAADISVVYMLFLLKLIKQLDDAPEAVKTYFERMTGRPSWAVASAID